MGRQVTLCGQDCVKQASIVRRSRGRKQRVGSQGAAGRSLCSVDAPAAFDPTTSLAVSSASAGSGPQR